MLFKSPKHLETLQINPFHQKQLEDALKRRYEGCGEEKKTFTLQEAQEEPLVFCIGPQRLDSG